jgi:indolepyruvate decarboxylase
MPSLSHALLNALKDQGAHEIFDIPADFVLPLFKVIKKATSCRVSR